MKTQNTLLLAATAVTVLNFQSCSKNEDAQGETGPLYLFKTIRLTGEWEVVKLYGQNVPSGYEITMEFERDGDLTYSYSYSYYGYNYNYSFHGEWEWKDNKDSIEIQINTGYGSSSIEFKVLRLTNDELVMEDNNGEWELEKD